MDRSSQPVQTSAWFVTPLDLDGSYLRMQMRGNEDWYPVLNAFSCEVNANG